MSKAAIIQELEKSQLKSSICAFCVGDTIRVHTRIIEGEKERVQIFMGTVIARKGTGLSETFSVHRVAYGEGMERVFPLNSPRIAKIEVVKEGAVRRGKLYYLRGTSGKKSKVKASRGRRKVAVAAVANSEKSNDSVENNESTES
ncbi:MAG: 50S ribosomal protein L19 [Parachlamydiaceae bacterium]|nr:50S ribosomal protein L19 [Parachlamydiaceae bacterium]